MQVLLPTAICAVLGGGLKTTIKSMARLVVLSNTNFLVVPARLRKVFVLGTQCCFDCKLVLCCSVVK